MNIPFVDLKAQYKSIQAEIDNVIQEVLDTTAFIKGPFVKKFEEHFGNTMGVENVVSCANGTDAIYITLKALGIGPGDEVITVANSWISTSETISLINSSVASPCCRKASMINSSVSFIGQIENHLSLEQTLSTTSLSS